MVGNWDKQACKIKLHSFKVLDFICKGPASKEQLYVTIK